jgi:hypothetical protein
LKFRIDSSASADAGAVNPASVDEIERHIRAADPAEFVERTLQAIGTDWKRSGDHILIRNPRRSDRNLGSFSINPSTGKWKEFSAETEAGGSTFAGFWGYVHGIDDINEVRRRLGAELGMEEDPRPNMSEVQVARERFYEWREREYRRAGGSEKDFEDPYPQAVFPVPDHALKTRPPFYEGVRAHAYRDGLGRLMFYAVRVEDEGGGKKLFGLSWWQESYNEDPRWQWKWPKRLPLYGLDKLAERPGAVVLLVEGEKTAERAGRTLKHRCVVVGLPRGSNAVRSLDLEPLRGRHVVLAPDRDASGRKAMKAVSERLSSPKHCPAASVRRLDPPQGPDDGWDLADAEHPESLFDTAVASPVENEGGGRVRLSDFGASVYSGPAAEREWLVERVLPAKEPVVLASNGGLGKSFLMLEACYHVAAWDGTGAPPQVLGGAVRKSGRVVFLSAEDDRQEIQRRLETINAGRVDLNDLNERLIVVPFPSIGGARPLVKSKGEDVVATDDLLYWTEELRALQPALVVVDTISAFFAVDQNNSQHAQQTMGLMGSLGQKTGATMVCTHHIGKPPTDKRWASEGELPDFGPDTLRDMVKGSNQWVNAARAVVVLWTPHKRDLEEIGATWPDGTPLERTEAVFGGVAKKNFPGRPPNVHLAVGANGFEPLERYCKSKTAVRADKASSLVEAVAAAKTQDVPFTKTGTSGLYARREELPAALQSESRGSIERLADDLIEAGRLGTERYGKKTVLVPL